MKRTVFPFLIIFSMMIIVSCNTIIPGDEPSDQTQTTTNGNFDNVIPLESDYEGALPATMQLAIGTLKLDATSEEINSQQATELLPLWKAVRSLSSSETVAQEELSALLGQISEAMSPEQMQTISDMQLSREDFTDTLQDLGVELGSFRNADPSMRATAQAMRESGQGPQGGGFGGGPGGGPGGGGQRGGFENLTPEQRETAMAERGGRGGFNLGLNDALIEAIIEMLEKKSS